MQEHNRGLQCFVRLNKTLSFPTAFEHLNLIYLEKYERIYITGWGYFSSIWIWLRRPGEARDERAM